MKALVLWARDHYPESYTLRIASRTPETVSGQVQIEGQWLPFRYDRAQQQITLITDDGPRLITINQWGWEQ